MEPKTLSFVCAASGADACGGDPNTLITRVCTDSRAVQPGDLFIALRGDRFDGHVFINGAAAAGAAAVMVERSQAPTQPPGCAMLTVEDTRAAFGRLAARYRADFQIPMVAVAGSNGKTTTKELLGAVLSQAGPALWSEASFNNDIGVPHTLLRLDRTHRAAVLEVGTNHPGELAPLVRTIQPRYGVLTSIGREHLEFFGDLAGVAREEGWLAELLPANGTLFINGDNEWTPEIIKRCPAAVRQAGCGPRNDWRAENIQCTERGTHFTVRAPLDAYSGKYEIPSPGRHQAVNALLALAVGAELGVAPELARQALGQCRGPKMRLQLWEANGIRVLDDAYNANADSMAAALETLQDLPCTGRRVAVLGDMAELGSHTAAAHREIGRKAGEMGLARLVVIGQWARETAQAAQAAGLRDVWEFPDVHAAAAALTRWTGPGDLVLLKASRAAGLERLGGFIRSSGK